MFGIQCFGKTSKADDKEIEIEQMSRDGSQYSLTGILLPPLGATATRGSTKLKLRPYVISPYNPRYM